ncbi:MAG TPA: hypothetical protein VN578_01715, partial [Candidatus Binatia bacterium]|nr:hypothetical protein [Candidatus Binatia bacterium]
MSLRAIDKWHLDAAEGWLGLGDWSEAIKELEKLPPQARLHPDALCARYMAFCTAKKWDLATKDARNLCRIAPHEVGGFIALASALNFQG